MKVLTVIGGACLWLGALFVLARLHWLLVVGYVCVSIPAAWKGIQWWRIEREVRRSLEPGAGLDRL